MQFLRSNVNVDTKLTLRWYDAQGCFESEEIDIVDQMPLFVVFLLILQRFSKEMWGIKFEHAQTLDTGDETYKLDEDAHCRFELVGRRTFGSSAVRVSGSSAGPEMFFKSSWVKCRDSKEPTVLGTARERANTRLPEGYRRMVTDHIPSMAASRVCRTENTATIRELILEADGDAQFTKDDVRKYARERVWLITRKLEPIQELDPADFWKVFWEMVRCKYIKPLLVTFI